MGGGDGYRSVAYFVNVSAFPVCGLILLFDVPDEAEYVKSRSLFSVHVLE